MFDHFVGLVLQGLRMLESWKIRLNNGSRFAVIMIGLFKVFDIRNHELLLVKLKAYGLGNS